MTSIKAFLIVVILSVVCLGNFVAALQGYRDSLQTVDNIEEQLLREQAHALEQLLAAGAVIPDNLFGDNSLYQVWSGRQLYARSNNAPEDPLLLNQEGFHLKSLAGQRWLVLAHHLPSQRARVIVATAHRAYSTLTEQVLLRAILPIIWILPVLGLLIWGIVTLGLKPMRRLARTLASRSANDLSILAPETYAGELKPIVESLNGLLIRLANAFEREKRFSADAAHELRTPLTALKINLHNVQATNHNEPAWQTLKRSADRMEHCIEQLLALHVESADLVAQDLPPLDLLQACQNAVAELYEQLQLKNQSIALLGEAHCIQARASSVDVLLRNLIANASKYTPDHGLIRITLGEAANRVTLAIEDSGPGIPEPELPKVLERFYRVGGDRNASKVVGSGLGLAIVADIVRSHSGDIHLARSSDLGGLAVILSFPTSGGSCDG